MALTPKKENFAREYLVDLNATKAAVRAGYSEKTAHSQGPRLLEDVDVAEFIEKVRAQRAEKTEINAVWVLNRLAAEAEADIADLYDDDGNILPIKEWPLIWRQGLVQGIEVEELFEGRGESRERVGNVRKIKLDNRIKRIELIGKHIGVNAFQDNIKVTGLDALADRLDRAAKRDD